MTRQTSLFEGERMTLDDAPLLTRQSPAQVMSYGGGRQSVAMCLLVAQGKLPMPDRIVCADPGREVQSTWDYLAEFVQPLLAPLGLEVEIAPHSLATVDLYDASGGPLMPLWTATGMLRTFCSGEWKVRVVQRYLRAQGIPEAVQWIGFSLDEAKRIKTQDSGGAWRRRYPLIEGMYTARDCEALILAAGYPLPNKSACYGCPHRDNAEWRQVRDSAADWAAAVALDEELRANDEQQAVYLHHSRVPLAMADLEAPDRRGGAVRQCGLGVCDI